MKRTYIAIAFTVMFSLLSGTAFAQGGLGGLLGSYGDWGSLIAAVGSRYTGVDLGPYKNIIQKGNSFDTATAIGVAQALASGKSYSDILAAYASGTTTGAAGTAATATSATRGFLPGTAEGTTDRSRIDLDEAFTNGRDHFHGYRSDEGMSASTLKRGSIITAGPHGAFTDLMNSKAITDQTLDLLGSDQVVANATFMMTEPAVGAAWHNAAILNRVALSNEYLADIHMMQQAMLTPEAGRGFTRSYLNCVANRISNVSLGGGLFGATAGHSWVEAQAACMNDRTNKIAGMVNFDSAPTAANAMQAKDDPNWYAYNDAAGTARGDTDPQSISLWSFLFPGNELIDTGTYPNPMGGAALSARQYMDFLHGVFESLIGNLVFSYGGADGLARRNFSVRRQPGLMSAADYIKKTVADRYNDIMDLEHDYCMYATNAASTAIIPKAADQATVDAYIAKINGYWRDTAAGPTSVTLRIQSLSFRGFKFKPSIGQDLYYIIEDRLGHFTTQADCATLDRNNPGSFKYPLDRLVGVDEAQAARVPKEQRKFYALAQRIADGQRLTQLVLAMDYVNQMVNGTFDDQFVRGSALRLIMDAAGVDDLDRAYLENLQSLQQGIDTLHSKVERDQKHQGLSSVSTLQDKANGARFPEAPSGIPG